MTGDDIDKLLRDRVEDVVRKIFPNASFKKGKAYVGSLSGEDGDSLCIELNGSKAGLWNDFADDSTKGGDLIQLWTEALCGGDYSAAMRQIREYLGLPGINKLSKFQSTEREFQPIRSDWEKLEEEDTDPITDYLVNERKIDVRTLNRCKVRKLKGGDAYVFPYWDDSKRLVNAKYVARERSADGKKKSWTAPGGKPVLWGMWLNVPRGWDRFTAVICEGELDAITLRMCGVQAYSIPYGAKNHQWLEYCHKFLQRFQRIVLCFDADDEGRDGQNGLLHALGNAISRVAELPEGEDVNSLFIKEGREALVSAVKNAKSVSPERFKFGRDIKDRIWGVLKGGAFEDAGDPFMDWSGRDSVNWNLRPRELTIWTGYPGAGKSALLYQMAAWLIYQKQKTVAIASLEEPVEKVCALIAIAQHGRRFNDDERQVAEDLIEAAKDRLIVYDYQGTAPVKDIMDFAEYSAAVAGADHFILDSVAKTDLNIENHEASNAFMGEITSSMFATGAHYHILIHSRKGNPMDIKEIPRLDSIKGSNCFGIECFNVVTVWRNLLRDATIQRLEEKSWLSDDEESKLESMRKWAPAKLVVSKQKVGGHVGEYDLWFNDQSYTFSRRPINDNPDW